MTKEEFLERKAKKLAFLKKLAATTTTTATREYDDSTLNLFGSDLIMFIEYGDISEYYIRNSLCFLLSHEIISIEQYKTINALIIGANDLHTTIYCD